MAEERGTTSRLSGVLKALVCVVIAVVVLGIAILVGVLDIIF